MLIAHDYNIPERELVTGTNQLLIGYDSCRLLMNYLDKDYVLFLDSNVRRKSRVNALLDSVSSRAQAVFYCDREPQLEQVIDVSKRVARALDERKATIVAIGGGSTIDFAKAVFSVLNSGEIYCRDTPFRHPDSSLIVLPTTAGSGSEVSRFSVITDEAGTKRSARSWDLRPDLTILDPQLLEQVPTLTLLTWSFDAFNHLLEASLHRFEKTMYFRPLIKQGIKYIIEAVRHWQSTGDNTLPIDVIKHLQLASVYGGTVISNVRTSLLHALAESYASRSCLSHSQTLVLFYRQVYAFYHEEIDAILQDMDFARGLGNTESLLAFWHFLDIAHYSPIHNDLMQGGSLSELSEAISTLVLRDKVLIEKESPKKLDEKIIAKLVRGAFNTYLKEVNKQVDDSDQQQTAITVS